jgi:hypothetical protein
MDFKARRLTEDQSLAGTWAFSYFIVNNRILFLENSFLTLKRTKLFHYASDSGLFRLCIGPIFRSTGCPVQEDVWRHRIFQRRSHVPFDHPKRGRGMPYWEIPPDVLEDKTELATWAEKSFKIAVEAKKK